MCVCVRAAPPASFPCVDMALIDVPPPCDIEQPQHNIQLSPPKEPPSRADPVSETRQDAVKSADIGGECVLTVERTFGPCRAWPPLAQAADIYTLLKYPDHLQNSD